MHSKTPVPFPTDEHSSYWWGSGLLVNPSMFSLAPDCLGPGLTNCGGNIGQLGDSPRDFLTNPPLRNWDFSIVKDTKVGFLGESGMIEFRTEIFNILNHPFFGPASGTITTANSTPETPRRQIQFALKLFF